jgi:hypothetical protein
LLLPATEMDRTYHWRRLATNDIGHLTPFRASIATSSTVPLANRVLASCCHPNSSFDTWVQVIPHDPQEFGALVRH